MLRELHAKQVRPSSYNLIWSPPLFGRQTWKETERCNVWVSALFEIASKNPQALVVKPVEIFHPQIASLNASLSGIPHGSNQFSDDERYVEVQ